MIYHLHWDLPDPNQDMLAQLRVRVPPTVDPMGRRWPRPLVLFNVLLRQNQPGSYTVFFHHPPALDPKVLMFLQHNNTLFLLFKIRLSSRQERLQEDQHGRVHMTQRTLQPVPPAHGVRYGVLHRPQWDAPLPHQPWQPQPPRRFPPLGCQQRQDLLDQDWLE